MRFSGALWNQPYKTVMLKNHLHKPWWEYTRSEIAGKDFFQQGPPKPVEMPRLAPHLDPGRSFVAQPRDIEHLTWAKEVDENFENQSNIDVRVDQEYFAKRYCIIMDRRRCGNNPAVPADRDIYDIYLRDMASFGKPEDRIHRAEKVDLEMLGQYDGQPNFNNEKVLSLDVDKVLYYIGLGVSLGQDIAEILGVLGILPIHPQTNLRLKKVHETRANMPIHETPYMMGEVCSIEAAKKRLKMEDIKDYTDRDGIEALLTGELATHEKNLAKAKRSREKAQAEFQKVLDNERNIANNLTERWLGRDQPLDVTAEESAQ